ncbi:MAG: MFS transporter [Deltaproteobacteria bacterium]|nr:MFS transporter [Deltaproteobacteria bacterium]
MAKGRVNVPSRRPFPFPFHRAWLILSVSFLTTLTAAGIRASPTVLIHPFEAEFGWSRVAIASAISLNLFLFGVAAPISGWLLDRFGPRRVMMVGLFTLAFGVGATTLMREFWQFFLLWGIIVGLGAGSVGSVLSATVANRWFVARRGLALGILNSASSTGQLIVLPLFMAIIVWSGWRAGSLLLAVFSLCIIPVIFLLMRDQPADLALEPYGAGDPGAGSAAPLASLRGVSSSSESMKLREVFRSSTFWLLAGSFFICGGTANGLIGTHLIPHSIDHGIPQVTAAATVGIMGGLNFVGTVLSGWMTDRVQPRKWLAMVYALRGLSLFILPFVTDYSGLFLFAVIYGLDWFATVPPTVALTADTFGRNSVGRVYGWIFLSHQLGAAIMATTAGAIRVWLGDYQVAFLAGGSIAMIAAGLAINIRPQPQKVTLRAVVEKPAST